MELAWICLSKSTCKVCFVAAGYRVRLLGAHQADKVLETNFLRGEALSLEDYEANPNFPAASGTREDFEIDISKNLGKTLLRN